MAIDRRTCLLGLGSLPACGFDVAAETVRGGRYVAAYRSDGHTYGAAILGDDGRRIRSLPLPARGHDATASRAAGLCVVFARRPGNFAVAFSTVTAQEPVAFTTVAGRHFYGHGIFSADGRLLYSTENAFAEGTGRIGVYDVAAGFRRIGELPSHGVGPHDLALMPQGDVLVVANGGMREHPEFGGGRQVLNPGALVPSIAYVDARTGDLLERHQPASGSGVLSLRHLDVAPDGTVVIGCQAEHPDDPEPLVFRHGRQRDLIPIGDTGEAASLYRGYVSSVAIETSGSYAALTSSRSGMAAIVEIATGRVVRKLHMSDISGVAPGDAPRHFAFTSGTGQMALERSGAPIVAHGKLGWDNHLVRI